jgi:hypothetical protein
MFLAHTNQHGWSWAYTQIVHSLWPLMQKTLTSAYTVTVCLRLLAVVADSVKRPDASFTRQLGTLQRKLLKIVQAVAAPFPVRLAATLSLLELQATRDAALAKERQTEPLELDAFRLVAECAILKFTEVPFPELKDDPTELPTNRSSTEQRVTDLVVLNARLTEWRDRLQQCRRVLNPS